MNSIKKKLLFLLVGISASWLGTAKGQADLLADPDQNIHLDGRGGGIIAYSITAKAGTNQIFFINADGSGKKQISRVSGRACGPDWSSDGSQIVFYNHINEETWSLFKMKSNGENVRQLTGTQGIWDACPRWSPDGTRILFGRTYPRQEFREEIWIMNADGRNVHRVGNVAGNGPYWSNDGRKILFTSWMGSANEVFEMNADGSNPIQLTHLGSEIYWPKWSPDGSKIVFQSNKDGEQEIYTMNSDGNQITQLTFNEYEDSDPGWSPDGKKIVFVSKRTGNLELYTMNWDGTSQTKLTTTVQHAIQPDWKPRITNPPSQPSDFPKLSGPYLGQKPPGTTPELFAPGVISTGLCEVTCAFAPEGDEIIYPLVYRKPHSPKVHSTLVTSRMKNDLWSAPEVLHFSGAKYMDGYPFIRYDGKELFFQSDRPTNHPDLKNKYNIWRCQRVSGGWSDPEPLPLPINGRGDVSGPSLSLAGDFYFTLMNGGPLDGIYASEYRDGNFSEPRRLPESVNAKPGAFDGVIAPDGSYYLLNVYDKKGDTFGETDLYVTFKDAAGQWTPLISLGGTINTKLNEGSAMISPDGKIIFFSGYLLSHNFFNDFLTYADILNNSLKPQYGNSDIYWVSAEIIEELRPKE